MQKNNNIDKSHINCVFDDNCFLSSNFAMNRTGQIDRARLVNILQFKEIGTSNQNQSC